jgi:2-polyprenyl-3-methyl-5-hydroxy-6-metoxy-1,4-benzoquinol methylase
MNKYSVKINKKFGFKQIFPTPSVTEINKFYNKIFYSKNFKNFNNSSLKVQKSDKFFFDTKWDSINTNLKIFLKYKKNNISVLDIGCGWCQCLIYLKKKGFDCYGFDPSKESVLYGLKYGIKVKHAGMDKVDVFEGKKFNVVILNNVLEHLIDPEGTLKQIKKILKPKGIIMVEVPNDFNDFQIIGKKIHKLKQWWVSPPAHLNYFSKETLSKLINFLGFKVLLSHSSFPLEMFLLFGDNYIGDPKIGKICHKKRVSFEKNLIKYGKIKLLNDFYKSLAELNLGRTITLYAQIK